MKLARFSKIEKYSVPFHVTCERRRVVTACLLVPLLRWCDPQTRYDSRSIDTCRVNLVYSYYSLKIAQWRGLRNKLEINSVPEYLALNIIRILFKVLIINENEFVSSYFI